MRPLAGIVCYCRLATGIGQVATEVEAAKGQKWGKNVVGRDYWVGLQLTNQKAATW